MSDYHYDFGWLFIIGSRHASATRPVHTRFQNNTFTSAPSITGYNKLIGGLVRSFQIDLLSLSH